MLYRYVLEPLPDYKFDKKRTRVAHCPCGKNNNDGKFAPYIGYDDRGHCHSCGLNFIAPHTCPECHSRSAFSRYIDTQDGNTYVDDHLGYCHTCKHHEVPPKEHEKTRKTEPDNKPARVAPPKAEKPFKQTSYVPTDTFKATLRAYQANHLIQFLNRLYGADITAQLIARYYVGTSKHWQGATVFYQIDKAGRIRAGKVMLYDPNTGKRVKQPQDHFTYLHTALKLKDYTLEQCFFGEHLLSTEPSKTVAIVESEKTAMIASAFVPGYIWLASGGMQGLTPAKWQALKGRRVVLYPDTNGFEDWSKKAEQMQDITESCTVATLLQSRATALEIKAGLDLADYLIAWGVKPEQAAPSPQAKREYYHMSYTELIAELGRDGARAKAEYYKKLARQFRSCTTYILHTCQLLTTYQNHYINC